MKKQLNLLPSFCWPLLLLLLSASVVNAQPPSIPVCTTVQAVPFGNGLFSATIPPGANCFNGVLIDWSNQTADDCQTPVPSNGTTLHQYQTCGPHTVTISCLGAPTPICTTTINLPFPSITATTSVSTFLNGSPCGEEIELLLEVGNNPVCGLSFPSDIILVGMIPSAFEIVGGDYTVNGQEVSLTIPGNTIPSPPTAPLQRRLRLRPRYCTSPNSALISLTATTEDGFGLGIATCSEIINPPTQPVTINTTTYSWVVFPRSPCLSVVKTTTTPNIQQGGTAQFQVVVQNTGNFAASDISVRDVLPSGFVVQSLPAGTPVPVSGVATTPIAVLAPGASQTLNYTLQHTPVPCGPQTVYTNCAQALVPSCNYSGTTSCASVTVAAQPVMLDATFTGSAVDCNTWDFAPVAIVSGQTHSWNFGNGNTSTAANPLPQNFPDGTFTITHTVSQCGQSQTATQTITVFCSTADFACPCTSTNSLNIEAGPTNPYYNAALGGTLYSELEAANNYDTNNDGILDATDHNGCLAINGNLIIDQSLSIQNATEARMQPCSQITIRRSNAGVYPVVTIRNNRFSSCETMWRGIYVSNNCTLNFIRNLIQDAEFALDVSGDADLFVTPLTTTVNIQNNNFNRNHVGVRFSATSIAAGVAHIPVVGNVFQSPAPTGAPLLLPPCSENLANYSAFAGYAGVVSRSVDLVLGDPNTINGFFNFFRTLRNGVIIENATLEVFQNSFQEIYSGAIFPNTPTNQLPSFNNSFSIGIMARNSRATIRNSEFRLCGHGIYGVNNGNLQVLTNQFNAVGYGVQSFMPSSLRFVRNQDMGFALNAFRVTEVNNWEYGDYLISRNSGRDGAFLGLVGVLFGDQPAVLLENASISVLPAARIDNNEFGLVGTSRSGFGIKNLGGWIINDNTVTDLLENSGFRLENSARNRWYGNKAYGYEGLNVASGYWLKNSTENLFCCNYAEGTQYGHRFELECNATDLRHSSMTWHEVALYCVNNTRIGQQYDRGNLFEIGSGKAVHDGLQLYVFQSQFNVEGLGTPNYPEVVVAPNQDPLQPWFKTEGTLITCGQENGENQICQFPGEPSLPPKIKIDDVKRSVAKRFLQGANDVLQWEGERALYAALQQNPDLLGQEELIDTFFTEAQSGSIGAYYAADQAVQAVRVVPESLSEALLDVQTQLDKKSVEIEDLLLTLPSVVSAVDSTEVYEKANSRLIERVAITGDLNKINQEWDSLRNIQIQAALSLNLALAANTLWQDNRKQINLLYLQTLAQNNPGFTATQQTQIAAIANQCLLDGGGAVLDARMLYGLWDQKRFDDDSLCASAFRPLPAVRSVAARPAITLSPNPAHEQVRIAGLAGPAEVRLSDLTRHLRLQQSVAPEDAVVLLKGLPAGVYLCQVYVSGLLVSTQKIVVAHP